MRKIFRSIWHFVTTPIRFFKRVVKGIINSINRGSASISSFFKDEEIDDTPIGESLSATIENPKALLPHINALRKHLLRSVIAVTIATGLSFAFIQYILAFLAAPMEGGVNELIAIDVTENVGTVMRVTLLSGFTIALPYIIFEIWLFIAPALRVKTRIKGLFAIPVALTLFVGGMAFAFFVFLPTGLEILFNFKGLTTQPRPSSYFNFVTLIMFWIGLSFEYPLIIYLLARLGFIKSKTLASQWKLAVVVIAVLAAAITPTVDPVNMGIVMAPMVILYFIGIGLARIAERGRNKEEVGG